MSQTPPFRPGRWHTVNGSFADINRVKPSGTLVGHIVCCGIRFNCEWAPEDGRRMPRGGSDPFDLVAPP